MRVAAGEDVDFICGDARPVVSGRRHQMKGDI
jgi:hypothetical protein